MPDSSSTSAPAEPHLTSANRSTSRRLWRGFGWGVAATIAMSVLMIIGMATGIAPMPMPIPAAIMGTLFGKALAGPLLMILAIGSHLAYGGFWGTVLARVSARVTVWKGLGLGCALWLLMQLAVLPWLGWGLFGTAETPAIAVATLALHLIYGAVLGWGFDRGR